MSMVETFSTLKVKTSVKYCTDTFLLSNYSECPNTGHLNTGNIKQPDIFVSDYPISFYILFPVQLSNGMLIFRENLHPMLLGMPATNNLPTSLGCLKYKINSF